MVNGGPTTNAIKGTSPKLDDGGPETRAIEHVRSLAEGTGVDASLPITVHFHPDRMHAGVPLLDLLSKDGVYRSQFETGTSNGGLTAFAGGQRWTWEQRIFGGAYDDHPPARRPKYGSLNYRNRSVGGSPRFGSCYLRLDSSVIDRATFCFPDSFFEPVHFGTATRMGLIEHADRSGRDELDRYIEAQVHGPLLIARDCRALVLDPSFRGTAVDEQASRLASAHGLAIEWHAGFRASLEVLEVHSDYRGPEIVELARLIARGQVLTPELIGRAANSGGHDSQQLKRGWHMLARFGCQEPR